MVSMTLTIVSIVTLVAVFVVPAVAAMHYGVDSRHVHGPRNW